MEATARAVMPTGDVVDSTLADLIVDPATHRSFVPSAGSADVDLRDDREGSETVDVSFEFTAQSPVDRAVTLTTQP